MLAEMASGAVDDVIADVANVRLSLTAAISSSLNTPHMASWLLRDAPSSSNSGYKGVDHNDWEIVYAVRCESSWELYLDANGGPRPQGGMNMGEVDCLWRDSSL